VTALWNANAFFAYIFSVKILDVPIEGRKLGAVLLATAGVLVVVYGGSQAKPLPEPSATAQAAPRVSGPLVGDLLTLTASIGYGLYQVLYKKYASFNPESPRPAASSVTRPAYQRITSTRPSYQRITSEADDAEASYPAAPESADAVYPPPFGLFANFLTAAVGLCTVVVLGLLVPILDWLGAEPFRAPPDLHTFGAIATIALSGVVFNSGFMASQLDPVSYHSVANNCCRYCLGSARRMGPRRDVRRRPDDDRSHPHLGRPVRQRGADGHSLGPRGRCGHHCSIRRSRTRHAEGGLRSTLVARACVPRAYDVLLRAKNSPFE
jgi:hypothetical protein